MRCCHCCLSRGAAAGWGHVAGAQLRGWLVFVGWGGLLACFVTVIVMRASTSVAMDFVRV